MTLFKHVLVSGFTGAIGLCILAVIGQAPVPRWALYAIVAVVAVGAVLLALEHGILKPRRLAAEARRTEDADRIRRAAGLAPLGRS